MITVQLASHRWYGSATTSIAKEMTHVNRKVTYERPTLVKAGTFQKHTAGSINPFCKKENWWSVKPYAGSCTG
jgi:hypothetical protein